MQSCCNLKLHNKFNNHDFVALRFIEFFADLNCNKKIKSTALVRLKDEKGK